MFTAFFARRLILEDEDEETLLLFLELDLFVLLLLECILCCGLALILKEDRFLLEFL